MVKVIDLMKQNSVASCGRRTFILAAILASFWALPSYPGNGYIYLLFSLVTNALLYMGFRKNAIFFDAFIGIFFWMGFWLKLTIRIVFFDGRFSEAVGAFDYSRADYDYSLVVSTCGIFGLLLSSVLREKFLFNHSQKQSRNHDAFLLTLYQRYRKSILFGFFCAFSSVAVLNIVLGIYQKGAIPQTTLPFGLNGVFKWLILFGLASFSTLILKFELVAKKQISMLVILLVLLESFATNTSLLSRGMVLNVGALVFGVYVFCRMNLITLSFKTWIVSGVLFCVLFLCSIFVVNDLRGNGPGYLREGSASESLAGDADVFIQHATPLLLNRWVGIEGVMAVSSSSRLGWDIWRDAWKERYSEGTMGFYDANLIDSPYKNTDFSKHHHLSLPGILAFFFYPGSFAFLFFCMLFIGIFAAAIEFLVFRFGGQNLILCALMAEVVAYRYVSFGYVPAQSYLLFGTIALNILIIHAAYRFAAFWVSKAPDQR